MENLNNFTMLLIFVCGLIALPALGLACGALMTFPCGFIMGHIKSMFDKMTDVNDLPNWKNSGTVSKLMDAALIASEKTLYLICIVVYLPVLLVLVLVAAFAFFAPFIGALAAMWNWAPVPVPTLVVVSGIFIAVYAGVMLAVAFRFDD